MKRLYPIPPIKITVNNNRTKIAIKITEHTNNKLTYLYAELKKFHAKLNSLQLTKLEKII